MYVDIRLLPFAPSPRSLSGRVVVVIDILRATSVIVHALSQGAREIIPVKTVKEALRIAKTFPPRTILLGGERESKKIEGFDLGNSPREYEAEKVKGKRLILTTTNGTKAFHAVSSAPKVLVGSFFNIGAVAEKCYKLGQDILIYPSGDEGNFSLEDTICGGMLIDRLIKKEKRSSALTDASRSAHILFQRFEPRIVESFYLSKHGRDLVARGFEEDLPYCARVDTTNLVPVFEGGVIRVIEGAVGRQQKAASRKQKK
ncbi:MAG: 2-phosphosulfolactate phosphatase [Thermodesulfobacteriota bacterium]